MENINTNKLSDQELDKVAGGAITPEDALAAALSHAKLTKDQVDFVKKIERDYEHGKQIFEVEFYKDGFEYEFEIDAKTGRILKHKKEWD